MTTLEIALLLIVLVVAILGYVVVKLHMVHGAVVAPVVAPAPPIATEVVPAQAKPAPAAPVVPGTTVPSNAMLDAYLSHGSGNATPGAPVSNFDARSLISDDTVLTVGGTKFRTPQGIKRFTLPLTEGRSYQLTTADGNAKTTVTVTDASGNELGKDSNGNGYAQVYFTAKASGTATVLVDFEGTYPDAGIEVHATPI